MMLTNYLLALVYIAGPALASSHYNVEIPETAAVVSNWDEYRTEVRRWPDSIVEYKYGGFVVEVDDKIVLATDENLTNQMRADLNSREENKKRHGGQNGKFSKRRDREMAGGLEKRACRDIACYDQTTCWQMGCNSYAGGITHPVPMPGTCY